MSRSSSTLLLSVLLIAGGMALSGGCSYLLPSCQTVPGCPDGQYLCNNLSCSDLRSDPFNCGFCNNSCGAGLTCQALGDGGGVCGCTGPGVLLRDGRCLALQVDPLNCGQLGNVCRADEVCLDGGCACPAPSYLDAGSSSCAVDGGTACVDLGSDVYNCGGCGRLCSGSCTGGVCLAADAGAVDGGDGGASPDAGDGGDGGDGG